jgi:hypothetical protein
MVKKIAAFLVISTISIYGSIFLNDDVCFFNPSPEKQIIEDNIIEGAALYLSSMSKASLLLMEYERGSKGKSINIDMGLIYTKGAVEDLAAARQKYLTAIQISKKIGINKGRRVLVENFPFDDFITNRNLRPSIALKLKDNFQRLDIIGIYSENLKHIDTIINTLKLIENDLYLGQRPHIDLVHQLFQEYAEASLYGNYATLMGSTILQTDGPPICKPD